MKFWIRIATYQTFFLMHTVVIIIVHINIISLFDVECQSRCQRSIKKEKLNDFSRSVIASHIVFLPYMLLMKITGTKNMRKSRHKNSTNLNHELPSPGNCLMYFVLVPHITLSCQSQFIHFSGISFCITSSNKKELTFTDAVTTA